jgi:hypothetical protein
VEFEERIVISPIVNYFKWLALNIQELNKVNSANFSYKIIDKEFCKKSNTEKLVIQVMGKNAFISIAPQELMLDEYLLRGFSPLDVRTITYLALNNSQSLPKRSFYKIISQFFSSKKNQEMLTIQNLNANTFITKSAQEISKDPSLIKKLEPEDAHRIGYITGTEQILQENTALNEIKHDNK